MGRKSAMAAKRTTATERTGSSPHRARALLCAFVAATGLVAGAIPFSRAANLEASPPLLGDDGVAGYREFLESGRHRAFAIAPGGAWARVSEMPDPDVAETEAIRACSGFTDQRCTVYAVDGQVVLDMGDWEASWGPYMDAGAAALRPVGTRRSMRFPDVLLAAPDGTGMKISDLRGRLVLLHFWGSWCAPCQAEFPDLQRLYDSLAADDRIAFVLMQSREDIERSRLWASRRGITMPLFDSGARGPSDHVLRIADGTGVEDRFLAPLFPATYVLDGHGIIIFSHFGPLGRWPEYGLFLRHAADHLPR